MNSEFHQRVEQIYAAVRALEPEQRQSYLLESCADDPRLMAEVQSRLSRDESPAANRVDTDKGREQHTVSAQTSDYSPLTSDYVAPSTPQQSVVSDPFADYELLEKLGAGGMGVVYRARQCSANREVALKIIRPELLDSLSADRREQLLHRFHTEAEAAARLTHDHLITVHEVGNWQGQPFFSMRYIPGKSLAQILREGPVTPEQAATFLEPVARAVHAAHEQGILHRDLKPANIMVDADNRPFVADFGLAKLQEGSAEITTTGELMGTPGYMSPEQARGLEHVTAASDVYSLGATLYHLLTGRPPFQSASLADTLRQIEEKEPVSPRLLNPSVPKDLETICLKCLQKEPSRRYATASEFAEDLSRYLRHEPIRARPTPPWEHRWKWCRRRPALATLTTVSALLLIGFVLTVMIYNAHLQTILEEVRKQKQRANENAQERIQ